MYSLDTTRSLFVLLGARIFPKYPALSGGTVFARSADEILAYVTDASGLCVAKSNVLDLFDDSRPAADQLEEIARFFSDKQVSRGAENVFIYYVGHGLFTPADRKYCLALRCTNVSTIGFSAMRARDLAEVVKTHASHLRRFLILDCCFAGSMVGEFLSAAGEAASLQMMEDLPLRGTCLLCASSSDDAALGPRELGMTMFSHALLKVLREGNPSLSEKMCMSEVKDTVIGLLRREHSNWVRPELHSPDMREGEIALLPFFPNPARSARSIPAPQLAAGPEPHIQEISKGLDRETSEAAPRASEAGNKRIRKSKPGLTAKSAVRDSRKPKLTELTRKAASRNEAVFALEPAAAVRNVLAQAKWKDKVLIEPKIPANQLANACQSCGVGPGKVFALIDTTVFGSAKEAVLFGAGGVYFVSDGTPNSLSYDDLKQTDFLASDAPLLSRYVSQVSFTVNGKPQRISIAGGAFRGPSLVELFKELKAI